ncbi:4Fe-4S single cluster domain-containing protein (plasmid) [Mycolicibacterium aichiense]|uniref:4Fe-4S single cluster domain-containing protein n=1 Tax=Mycolicibacterium aichiense TaxID=1799 RepID=UPI003D66B21D
MMSMLLSRLHYPVRNLGYGHRAGIWFQGCSVHCRGCVSRDTWAFTEESRCEVDSVLRWLEGIDGPLDGITISGGEPTDQPEALRALLEALTARGPDIDVLMFSGRSFEELIDEFPWLLHTLDVVISEPFDRDQADAALALRGSANQRVHRLSPLGEQRYPGETFEARYGPQREKISINVDDRSVWMVGIPKAGDMARLRHLLEARGISIGRSSWLS